MQSAGKNPFQKQTRKHNRRIHKQAILKGGASKLHQASSEVRDFRLFDKALCQGRVGFIFDRRSSGYFEIRGLTARTFMRLSDRTGFVSSIAKEYY